MRIKTLVALYFWILEFDDVTCIRSIHLFWKSYQDKIMKELGQKVVIAGDGRHDSMGHSAKFGAYTIFCCTVPLIIHFSLVQVMQ